MHTPDEALTLRDPQALLAQTLRDWPADATSGFRLRLADLAP